MIANRARIVLSAAAVLVALVVYYLPVVFTGHTLSTLPLSFNVERSTLNHDPAAAPTFEDWHIIDVSSGVEEEAFAYINARLLRSGQAPIWNPYQGCGAPLAANMLASAFYPLSVFVNLFPWPAMWDAFLLLRLAVAGLGMWLYLRHARFTATASFGGAIAFMLSGFMTQHVNMLHMNVEALYPWVFWSIDRLLDNGRGRRRWGVPLIVFTVVALGGHPEPAVLLCGWSLVYVVARVIWMRRHSVAVSYGATGVVVIVWIGALALSAFLIIPFVELYLNSHHTHSGDLAATANSWRLHLALIDWRLLPISEYRSGFYCAPPVGYAVLFLAAIGAFWRGPCRGRAWFWAAVMVLSILKSAGAPLLEWVGELPVLGQVVFTKYLAPLYFGAAFLCARGLTRIETDPPRHALSGTIAAVFAIFWVAVIWSVGEWLMDRWTETAGFHLQSSIDLAWERWRRAVVVSLVALSGPAAFVAIARVDQSGKRRAVYAWLVAIFVFLNLWDTRMGKFPQRTGGIESAPYLDAITERMDPANDRIYATGAVCMPNIPGALGIPDARALDQMEPDRYWRFMKVALTREGEDYDQRDVFSSIFTGGSSLDVISNPLLDLVSARWIVSEHHPAARGFASFASHGLDARADMSRQAWVERSDPHTDLRFPIGRALRFPVENSSATLTVEPRIEPYLWRKVEPLLECEVWLEDRATSRILASKRFDKTITEADFAPIRVEVDRNDSPIFMVSLVAKSSNPEATKFDVVWRNLFIENDDEPLPRRLKRIYADDRFRVWENPDALPRFSVVGGVRKVDDGDAALAVLQNERHFDPRGEVIVENELAGLSPQPQRVDHTVSVVENRASCVRLDVTANAPGVLLQTDTWYPGWSARVDGEPTTIHRVNYFQRGIVLPEAGSYEIEIVYRPASYRLGVAISVLTLVLALGLAVWQRGRASRR